MSTERTGIQSIELAAPILRALADAPGPLPLRDLAVAADMPRGQAHKYLVSLVRSGLATQPAPGEPYGLGPLSLSLGLAALRRLDIVTTAQGSLNGLRDRLDTSAVLAIWGNRGPTIVRLATPSHLTSPLIQIGTVFPVATSLVGRVFAAYLDRKVTLELIRDELEMPNGAAYRAGLRTLEDVDKQLNQVRRNRYSSGPTMAAGVVAIAAPIFDHTNGVVAVLAVAGLSGKIQTSRHSEATTALIEATDNISRQLGAFS